MYLLKIDKPSTGYDSNQLLQNQTKRFRREEQHPLRLAQDGPYKVIFWATTNILKQSHLSTLITQKSLPFH